MHTVKQFPRNHRIIFFTIISMIFALPNRGNACSSVEGAIPERTLPEVYKGAALIVTGVLTSRDLFERFIDLSRNFGSSVDYPIYNLEIQRIVKGSSSDSIAVKDAFSSPCPIRFVIVDQPSIFYLSLDPESSRYFLLRDNFDISELEGHELLWQRSN